MKGITPNIRMLFRHNKKRRFEPFTCLDLVNRVGPDAEMHVVAKAGTVPQRKSVTGLMRQQFRDVLRETGFSSGDNFMIIQWKLLPLYPLVTDFLFLFSFYALSFGAAVGKL